MSKHEGVTVGNAAKVALDVVDLAFKHQIPIAAVAEQYVEAIDTVLEVMAERTAGSQIQEQYNAAQAVKEAFPGTTEVNTAPNLQVVAPPAAAAPAPAPAPAGVPSPVAGGPAPVPGVAAGPDELWKAFFASIQNGTFDADWEDNREKKAQGGKFARIPDFSSRKIKNGDRNAGLYLDDKKQPAWVTDQLRQMGLVA